MGRSGNERVIDVPDKLSIHLVLIGKIWYMLGRPKETPGKSQSRLENCLNFECSLQPTYRLLGRGCKSYGFKVFEHNLCSIIGWSLSYVHKGATPRKPGS